MLVVALLLRTAGQRLGFGDAPRDVFNDTLCQENAASSFSGSAKCQALDFADSGEMIGSRPSNSESLFEPANIEDLWQGRDLRSE